MKEYIEGTDIVEAVIGKWFPGDLAYIVGLELKNSISCPGMDMVIEALFQPRSHSWPDVNKEFFSVKISFFGISNLSLKGFSGSAVQVMGFDIHFVGDRGMEGINFEIEDYEDDRIKFCCSKIIIQSVTKSGSL